MVVGCLRLVIVRAFYLELPEISLIDYRPVNSSPDQRTYSSYIGAGHSWKNYIYSSSTRYGDFKPCVILKFTSVLACLFKFSVHRFCPVVSSILLLKEARIYLDCNVLRFFPYSNFFERIDYITFSLRSGALRMVSISILLPYTHQG